MSVLTDLKVGWDAFVASNHHPKGEDDSGVEMDEVVVQSSSNNEASVPDFWYCSICTLVNDKSVPSCGVCGTLKALGEDHLLAGSNHEVPSAISHAFL